MYELKSLVKALLLRITHGILVLLSQLSQDIDYDQEPRVAFGDFSGYHVAPPNSLQSPLLAAWLVIAAARSLAKAKWTPGEDFGFTK